MMAAVETKVPGYFTDKMTVGETEEEDGFGTKTLILKVRRPRCARRQRVKRRGHVEGTTCGQQHTSISTRRQSSAASPSPPLNIFIHIFIFNYHFSFIHIVLLSL